MAFRPPSGCSGSPFCFVKAKLLVLELWAFGDLAIATPFLTKASEHFDVSLLAKPGAFELQSRFWPQIKVIPFVAPWTAFRGKYRFLSWPWQDLISLGKRLRREGFDAALSARWDPRDHFLLRWSGAKARLGFPRLGSSVFLTHSLTPVGRREHRYENWRIMGRALNFELEAREQMKPHVPRKGASVLLHTGGSQPVKVWPLECYHSLARRLRERHYSARVVCDNDQREWWLNAGEREVATPGTITELLSLMSDAGAFIGNDSGPGHLAALLGIPTLTLFGPVLPEEFLPLNASAEWIEGKDCAYKPCSNYCRFPIPHCMVGVTEAEVWAKAEPFVRRHLA